jgi:hypothetical protein
MSRKDFVPAYVPVVSSMAILQQRATEAIESLRFVSKFVRATARSTASTTRTECARADGLGARGQLPFRIFG